MTTNSSQALRGQRWETARIMFLLLGVASAAIFSIIFVIAVLTGAAFTPLFAWLGWLSVGSWLLASALALPAIRGRRALLYASSVLLVISGVLMLRIPDTGGFVLGWPVIVCAIAAAAIQIGQAPGEAR
ncbi:hypothetical protein [Haematomicrobium sanguinis]|uniref:hypothetical protein n=1 Tax=Haematomicrobium sanguinis TaxID=479106 RepID=UPI0012F8799D|nr:hypothetical protein [Haematomicrobium sanguinis]